MNHASTRIYRLTELRAAIHRPNQPSNDGASCYDTQWPTPDILKAYTPISRLSIGNQITALFECQLRGIEPGWIDTYIRDGSEKGAMFRKGEKGTWVCVPVTRKRKVKHQGPRTTSLKL
ncbi:MAG: hypothetical protein ACREDR_16425 [Blastocatellia bacterium]